MIEYREGHKSDPEPITEFPIGSDRPGVGVSNMIEYHDSPPCLVFDKAITVEELNNVQEFSNQVFQNGQEYGRYMFAKTLLELAKKHHYNTKAMAAILKTLELEVESNRGKFGDNV